MGSRHASGDRIRLSGLLLLQFCWLAGCVQSDDQASPVTTPAESAAASTPVPPAFDFKPRKRNQMARSEEPVAFQFPNFDDAASDLGIDFVYDNGASPKALMVESTGGGCGWIDVDLDGRLDLYLSQGGTACGPPHLKDVFYRQLETGRFEECLNLTGITDQGFGHGIAVGDFDNDGFDDIFIANAGRNRLFRNQGDGTFEDFTAAMSGGRDVWSSSVAWGDVDKDGDLDLYVCNYSIYDPCNPVECLDKDGIPSICHPRNVEPEPDEFFVNQGDGTFVEASKIMGLYGEGNKGLGVVIADLTGDHWPDIYIANDTTANFFFVNDGTGQSFRESSLLLGGGYCATGEAQASMGIAYGDFDKNGYADLFLTHFTGEHNTLYQNMGPQGLQDVSGLLGLRQPSLSKLGFGTVMNDFNLDGAMDLFVTNGHIDPRYFDGEGYEMTPQVFSFDGRKWHEAPVSSGSVLSRKAVGRAVGMADFDGDGDADLCVVHHNSSTALLRNNSVVGNGLRLKLIGRRSNRSAFQARVKVIDGAGNQLVQEVVSGTSYNAAHDRELFFGFGNTSGPWSVEIEWPSGTTQKLEVPADLSSRVVLESASLTDG